MQGYQTNSACIADYLTVFQSLSLEQSDAQHCRALWADITAREAATPEGICLAPPLLRRRLALSRRDFLLTMAALALEMDGSLRGAFRRRYGLHLPTVEYGLQLIAPLCPVTCETLAELAGESPLCGLILTTAEASGYPLERPLILCRGILAFLTGLSAAQIPGCTVLTGPSGPWLPLHEAELAQVAAWYQSGGAHPLYLCAPAGAGRRTLVRRACGSVVCGNLPELSSLSCLDQDHALREMAVLARLLDAPVCAEGSGTVKDTLESLCRRHGIPLVFLAEWEGQLAGAREVVRLPRQLSAGERDLAWRAFAPGADPHARPGGAMTVGAVAETAALAERSAREAGHDQVTGADLRQAQLRRGGALELGVRYDVSVSMEDLVLPGEVRQQLTRICQAVRWSGALAGWGLPQSREGITAVFHGPSGTGKTMAAGAIAHDLGLPLLRADLSQIMDKYVGETEKHLGRLFQCARENRCVLLFDEADALFGKRADVSTGHDKYANLSTSYLLQEIEQYDGVALLSTNLLGNFDDAFLRRLQYIVRFTLPDAALREELWRRAIPQERRAGPIPFCYLARAELSPARIHAAVRSAALEALAEGRQGVDAAGVTAALALELEKSGKSLPRELAQARNTQQEVYVHGKTGGAMPGAGAEGPAQGQPDGDSHPDEAGL